MTIDLESEFSAINKKMATMQEFLEEIHRIVKALHEQWNTPSSMDIPIEAMTRNAAASRKRLSRM